MAANRLLLPALFFGVLLTAAIIAAAVWIATGTELARERVTWQVRLNAIAGQQAVAVERWTEQHFEAVTGLAQNAALQIYLSQLSQPGRTADQVAADGAQRQYLRILLDSAAERGFADKRTGTPEVSNQRRIGHAGLALLDNRRQLTLSTNDMPPIAGEFASRIAENPGPERRLLDLFRLADGQYAAGFMEPVYTVQAPGSPDQLTGFVLGVTPVNTEFFAALNVPQPMPKGAVSVLARRRGNLIEYFGIFSGNVGEPRNVAQTDTNLDLAFALANPGAFATRIDSNGTPVLITSREVAGSPWLVVLTVPVAEAMADVTARERVTFLLLLLSTVAVTMLLIAAWRQGASARYRALAGRYKDLSEQYGRQEQRLRLISDMQPETVLIVDADRHLRFANRSFAEAAGITVEDAIGKTIDAVVGPAAAAAINDEIKRCIEQRTELRSQRQISAAGKIRSVQDILVPLPTEAEPTPAALLVEQDITEVVEEREKREHALHQLIKVVLSALDQRDPFSARQSELVGALSRGVAMELHLSPSEVAAAEMAGQLMNFGKALVPEELLTRPGPLSAEEKASLRRTMAVTSEMIGDIVLEGPVAQALRDVTEHWDGSGATGKKGEQISLIGQIISAVNLFVAAATPRAWRGDFGVDRAVSELQAESEKMFERRVVSAVVNFIDNRGGRALFDNDKPRSHSDKFARSSAA